MLAHKGPALLLAHWSVRNGHWAATGRRRNVLLAGATMGKREGVRLVAPATHPALCSVWPSVRELRHESVHELRDLGAPRRVSAACTETCSSVPGPDGAAEPIGWDRRFGRLASALATAAARA